MDESPETFEQFVNAQLAAEAGYIDACEKLEEAAEAAEYVRAQQEADAALYRAWLDFEARCNKRAQVTSSFGRQILRSVGSFFVHRPETIRHGVSEHFGNAEKRNDLNPQFADNEA